MNSEGNNTSTCSGRFGIVAPVVDRNRCEGKNTCVEICPYDVFRIGVLTPVERKALSLVGKLKAWAHSGKQAYVVNPGACHACNLCIDACPENALQLVRLDASRPAPQTRAVPGRPVARNRIPH